MIEKLARAILTIIGASLGIFIGIVINQMNLFSLTQLQSTLVIIILCLIFGIIFYLLTPNIKKISLNIVDAFEKELLKFLPVILF